MLPVLKHKLGHVALLYSPSVHIFFRMWGRMGKWWYIFLHKLEISSRALSVDEIIPGIYWTRRWTCQAGNSNEEKVRKMFLTFCCVVESS